MVWEVVRGARVALFPFDEIKEFRKEKRVRMELLETDQLWCEILCYEPGQSTPSHYHPKQDEIFFVVEGCATMNTGGQEYQAGPATLILVPATVMHDIRNLGDTRLVMYFTKIANRCVQQLDIAKKHMPDTTSA